MRICSIGLYNNECETVLSAIWLTLVQFSAVLFGALVISGITANSRLGVAFLFLGIALVLLRSFMAKGTLTKGKLIVVSSIGFLGTASFFASPASSTEGGQLPQSEVESVHTRVDVQQSQDRSDTPQSETLDGFEDEDENSTQGDPIERRGVTQTPLALYEPSNHHQALQQLASLEVKGRAPKTGYSRGLFGQKWADVDRNGCDTRNDILGRDLQDVLVKPGTRSCVVLRGTLHDPYTGQTISFQRGRKTSSKVQIDHIVALSDAWQKGAQNLSVDERTAFANDPLNLLAVDGTANQQKSASDAASWLPKNKAFRCTYITRQIAVKAKYKLWVTQAEKRAMEDILKGCEKPASAPVPEPAPVPAPEPEPEPEAEPASAPQSELAPEVASEIAVEETPQLLVSIPEEPAPALEPTADVYYKNCKEAKAAGAAPLYAGEPGYRSQLDRDGDGIACER